MFGETVKERGSFQMVFTPTSGWGWGWGGMAGFLAVLSSVLLH